MDADSANVFSWGCWCVYRMEDGGEQGRMLVDQANRHVPPSEQVTKALAQVVRWQHSRPDQETQAQQGWKLLLKQRLVWDRAAKPLAGLP